MRAASPLPAPAEPVAGEPEPLAALVREALDAPRLTSDDIADRLGIPQGRLKSYHVGARRMPGPVRRRLAVVLAAQSAELARLSEALLAVDAPADLEIEEPATAA